MLRIRGILWGRFSWLLLGACLAALSLGAAPTGATPPEEVDTPRVHFLQGARIVVAPGEVLERGDLLLRDGLIAAVGVDLTPPADARVWDAESLSIYPGLIESYLPLSRITGEGEEATEGDGDFRGGPSPGTANTHPRVHPEFTASDALDIPAESWADLHALGFCAAYLVPDQGIFRGRGALLNLGAGRAAKLEIPGESLQCLAFDTGSRSNGYPRSLMGVVALLRQTFLDAGWYRQAQAIYREHPGGQERPPLDRSLAALEPALTGQEAVLIETKRALDVFRAEDLAQEFGLRVLLRGSGEEYKILDPLQEMQLPVICPVNFPEARPLTDPDESLDLSLALLRHWDRAPANPGLLAESGIPVALSACGLAKPQRFYPQLRRALSRGLDAEEALRALTVTPARLLGVEDRLGTLAPGKIANLVLADGELFAPETRIRQLWVDGEPIDIPLREKERRDWRGLWRLERLDRQTRGSDGGSDGHRPPLRDSGLPYRSWLRLEGESDAPRARLILPDRVAEALRVSMGAFAGDTLRIDWSRSAGNDNAAPRSVDGRLLLRAGILDEKLGWFHAADGDSVPVRARRVQGPPPRDREIPTEAPTPAAFAAGPLASPNQALIRGATLWTCADQGVLPRADLAMAGGRIAAVGEDLRVSGDAFVVEAEGLHLTPGIMDVHSHAMIAGDVNEGTVASSAMVRIADVLDSESLNFQRQLAGGVTLAMLIHGSANPIGGQTAVIKLRWGDLPAGLLLKEAPPGIKFALGENVTQKSWGGPERTRYPKTRMGVEQFIRDRFFAAQDYGAAWEEYESLGKRERARQIPPRRDLELEALLEVLADERYVHCHAYRQDEILMLMRVAEDFDFRLRTYIHVLEGYKVAPEMLEHGVMASTFSDWWAYKPEVYDAIPYAGALMHERGVNVTYKSDSAELARRLHLEAAKAMRYGGVVEEEALAFVTCNVAIQLGLDDRLGSLVVGKDADLALWSGHPLSSGSICLQTWVDGKLYFDREVDLERRQRFADEREALVAKYLRAGASWREDKEDERQWGAKAETAYEPDPYSGLGSRDGIYSDRDRDDWEGGRP